MVAMAFPAANARHRPTCHRAHCPIELPRCRSNVDSQDNDKVIAHKESGIVTVADLLGKKIGYVKGTSAHFLLEILLVEHGLVPSRVEVVDIKPVDVPNALVNRHVDAIAIWEPYATQALELLHKRAVQLSPPGTYRATYNFVAMQDFIHKRQGCRSQTDGF